MASLFSRPQLKLTIEQDLFFLQRQAPDSDGLPLAAPTDDEPEMRGTVLLSLPTAQRVKSVTVVTEGLCNAFGGGHWPYETSTTMHKEIKTQYDGELFERGKHGFNFAFAISSDTTDSQRCNFGRVRYYVKAVVQLDSILSSTVTSEPVAFWISTDPTRRDELPGPLEIYMEEFSEDLGPLRVAISSPHLTVASLVHSSISFVDPPAPVSITSIQTSVLETFTVSYEDGRVTQPPTIRNPLCVVEEGKVGPPARIALTPDAAPASPTTATTSDGLSGSRRPAPSPLARLVPGTTFTHGGIMRLPDDDHIRPTTSRITSKTRIRAAHALEVQVRYLTPSGQGAGEEKVLRLRRPVQIFSCCSTGDHHLLPAYTRGNPHTVIKPINGLPCICSISLKDMFDRDGEALQRAGSIERPDEGRERCLGLEGSEGSGSGSEEQRRRSAAKSAAYTTSEVA